MQASVMIMLFIAVLLALAMEQVFIATMLFLALIVSIVFFILSKIGSGAKKAGNSLTSGILTDMEKAKGQSPKAVDEFGKMFGALGSKTGDIAYGKENQTFGSPDLAGRLGTASKNLLDGLAKLFK